MMKHVKLCLLSIFFMSPLLADKDTFTTYMAKEEDSTMALEEAKTIYASLCKKCPKLYNPENYTNSPAYKQLTSLKKKKKYIKNAFLQAKYEVIKESAFWFCLPRVLVISLVVGGFLAGGVWIYKKYNTFMALLGYGIWATLLGSIVGYFLNLKQFIADGVTSFGWYLNPGQLFDFKQDIECKFMEAVAAGLEPEHVKFVISKLKELWDTPEEKKKTISIVSSFIDLVYNHEKKDPVLNLKAFREKIKHYPKKVREQAEFIMFALWTEFLCNKDKKKKVIIAFIGKPGYGKTRLGRIMAETLEFYFANVDLHGNSKEIFGERDVAPGSLVDALVIAKQQKNKNGYVMLCCDDVDRLINAKGEDVTQFLNFLDPTNYTYSNPFYGVNTPGAEVLIITGNFALKQSAIKDRCSYILIFDEPFDEEAKMAIAMESLKERLKSSNYKKLLGYSIDERLLKEKIRKVMSNPKNVDMTARNIQNKALELFIKAYKEKYDKREKHIGAS